jgi:hypothetical protein
MDGRTGPAMSGRTSGAPYGYADEHITHYSLTSLQKVLARTKFEMLRHEYIVGAELNVLAKQTQSKPSIAFTTSSVPTASFSKSRSSET